MHRVRYLILLSVLVVSLSGCQTLREVANLRNVSFALDRVGDASLAGIDLRRVSSYQDLTAGDVLSLTQAVTRNELPLAFTLHLNAENPPENDVQARLVEMDWTLLVDDSETVSGLFDDNIVLPPGEARDVPIPIRLDLVEFFDGGAQDLLELALAIAGQNGAPKRIQLRATPTIDTAIGPIRYPQPITIASRDVGS